MARTIHRFGCTAVERDDQNTVILHMGAHGHTEQVEVRKGVDAMLGKGTFGRIRPFARWERDGDGIPHQRPDIIYAFSLSNEMFDALIKKPQPAAPAQAALVKIAA